MFVAILGQTQREVMRQRQGRMPGCDSKWTVARIWCLKAAGTKGRSTPVDLSQVRMLPPMSSCFIVRGCRAAKRRVSGQLLWAAATAVRSAAALG